MVTWGTDTWKISKRPSPIHAGGAEVVSGCGGSLGRINAIGQQEQEDNVENGDEMQHRLNKPILIVGAPRSGTSILAWCLGQHPNILPQEESNWLGPFHILN